MKKLFLGLLLVSSLCVSASSSLQSYYEVATAVGVGIIVTYLYPAFVEQKPEDTLFIGEESGRTAQVGIRTYDDGSVKPYSDYVEKSRAGVALGKYFIGKKTENGKKYSGIMQDGNKPISRNDWYRLGTGVAAGLATYGLMKYCDKK